MSVVYDGSHSIDFWNMNQPKVSFKNSWDDLHLIPSSRPYVANVEPQYKYSNIPLTSLRIDTTEAYLEGILHGMRQGQWEFFIDYDQWEDWATCYRALVNYFHGFKMAARLKDYFLDDEERGDTDNTHIYQGRIVVQGYTPGSDYSKITLQYYFNEKQVDTPEDMDVDYVALWRHWDETILHESNYSWGALPNYVWSDGLSNADFEPTPTEIKGNQTYIKKRYPWETPAYIKVTRLPNKTSYYDKDRIDYTGIQVTVYAEDGNPYTYGGYSGGIIPFEHLAFPDIEAHYNLSNDKQTVTVEWYDSSTNHKYTTTFDITVKSLPTHIVISKNPDKMIYLDGDTIDFTGMVVGAYTQKGEVYQSPISFDELSFSTNKATLSGNGDQDITITWTNPTPRAEGTWTTTLTIRVVKEEPEGDTPYRLVVTHSPNKTSYGDGDDLDFTGMVITAYQKNGLPWTGGGKYPNGVIPISDLDISTSKASYGTDGNMQISIGYGGVTTKTSVTVEDKPYSIQVLVMPTKVEYDDGDTIDYTGMEVAAYKRDGTAWTNGGTYTDGVLPMAKLILPNTTAEAPSSGDKQTLTVQYKRESDDVILSTTLQVTVVDAGGPNLVERSWTEFIDNDATYIADYAFYSYSTLRMASFRNVSQIGRYAFYSTRLSSLYLLSNSIVGLTSTVDLSNYTSMKIYVPSSLYDTYKTANVWSAYSTKFASFTE